MPNYQGLSNNYQVFHFQVPAGADRLFAQLAWPVDQSNCNVNLCTTGNNSRVRMILVDPHGRFAAHSLPQGPASYGETEVESPAAGTWTGVIFGDIKGSGDSALGGTNGVVPWRVSTQQHVAFGSVSPSTVTLAPGQSQTVNVSANDPSSPGDAAGAVVLSPRGGTPTSIPVTLRSLVNPWRGGGFSGSLTGGNGRPYGQGQEQFYEFDVPPGVRDIRADVSFAHDPSDPVAEYLINPDGDTVGYGQNSVEGSNTTALSAYTIKPAPGRWTLIVAFTGAEPGDLISQPYQGDIRFDTARVRGSRVPNGQALRAGQPVTVPVVITNTGVAPEDYFIDPRLTTTENITLAPQSNPMVALPLAPPATPPAWLVPSETSALRAAQTSSVPAMFDLASDAGDPGDPALASASFGPSPLCAGTASLFYSPPDGTVTSGIYLGEPTECGPYTGPAPAGTATMALVAQTKAFDPAVSSTTGDFWSASVDPSATFSPIAINPGQTAVVAVTFTPTGGPGSYRARQAVCGRRDGQHPALRAGLGQRGGGDPLLLHHPAPAPAPPPPAAPALAGPRRRRAPPRAAASTPPPRPAGSRVAARPAAPPRRCGRRFPVGGSECRPHGVRSAAAPARCRGPAIRVLSDPRSRDTAAVNERNVLGGELQICGLTR